MSTNEEKAPKEKKENSKNKNQKINKGLKQTFPASDPPSHSQPGHGRNKKNDS